jgi:fluoride exporter
MLKIYLAVALGGALGSVGRYVFADQAARALGAGFPWGTLGVNVTGSLLMGIVAAWFAARATLPPEMQAFAAIGVLGGFTTFSAFSLDLVQLWERGLIAQALFYGAASVGLSVGALIAGLVVTRRLLAI